MQLMAKAENVVQGREIVRRHEERMMHGRVGNGKE
jgi:hypothetical protein